MKRKFIIMALIALMPTVTLIACDREGPMERAGEKVDKSVEEAGENVERAVEPKRD